MKKIVSKNDKMCLGLIGRENLSIPHPPLIDGQKFAGFWSARIPVGGTNCEGKKYHIQFRHKDTQRREWRNPTEGRYSEGKNIIFRHKKWQNCTTPPFNRNFGIFLGWHVIIWDGSQVKAFPNPDHPPLAIFLTYQAFCTGMKILHLILLRCVKLESEIFLLI